MLEDSKQLLPSKQDGTSRMVKLRSKYNNLTIMIIDNTIVVQEITNVDVQEYIILNFKLVMCVLILRMKNCCCIETALVTPPIPTYSLERNWVISLILLGQFIRTITEHSARCQSSMTYLGESHHYGLASVMVCQCFKCNVPFRFTTSNVISYNSSDHYSGSIGAILGQIATGGGADHLMEQFTCVQVPSRSCWSFIQMERSLDTAFEAMVGENLLIAGQKVKQLAIQQENYHNVVPAITVEVDAG